MVLLISVQTNVKFFCLSLNISCFSYPGLSILTTEALLNMWQNYSFKHTIIVQYMYGEEHARYCPIWIKGKNRCSIVKGKVEKSMLVLQFTTISAIISGNLPLFLPFLQRFTAIQKMRPPPPNPQEVRAQIAASQQSSQQNRRLAQQMANRPAVRAALGTAPPRQQQQPVSFNSLLPRDYI